MRSLLALLVLCLLSAVALALGQNGSQSGSSSSSPSGGSGGGATIEEEAIAYEGVSNIADRIVTDVEAHLSPSSTQKDKPRVWLGFPECFSNAKLWSDRIDQR